MKNVLIIGCGGIGSWLIPRINRLMEYKQLSDINVTVADNDQVEDKNLPYQNFDMGDIIDDKALIMDSRYNVLAINRRIVEEKELKAYDIIICAVDNAPTRRLVYKHCVGDSNKYFIDLRAEGSAVWAATSDCKMSYDGLLKTLGSSDEDRSCQLAFELDKGIIQLGNTVIAEIGAQYLLNHLRNKKNPGEPFSHRF